MPLAESRHRLTTRHVEETELNDENLYREQLRLAQRVVDGHNLEGARSARINYGNYSDLLYDNLPIFPIPYPQVAYHDSYQSSPVVAIKIGHPAADTRDPQPYITITFIENGRIIPLLNSAEAVAKIDEVFDILFPNQRPGQSPQATPAPSGQ